MKPVVLDASVLVASISPRERHHAAARSALDGIPATTPFIVPELFRVEVIAALARRGESSALLDTVAAYLSTARFAVMPMDAASADRAMAVAKAARIRAYDAVYVALALDHDTALLTLDAEIAERVRATLPSARVTLA